MNNTAEHEDFQSTSLAILIYKWRFTLIIIGIVAIVLSFIFSGPGFITPLYKSTVVLFPTSTNSISKALIAENTGSEKDILEFGEDEQTERLLQVLNSNRIRDRIISKHNLMKHYGIEPDSKYKNTRLFKIYESNINFKRTEYMAVKISVYDKNPDTAAMIANDIAALVDSTVNEIQKERAVQALNIVEAEYKKFENEIKALQDSLRDLMSHGVHDYESQAEMINQQLAIELANGNRAAVKRLEDKLESLAKYGGAYLTLTNKLEYDIEQFSIIKAKYKEAKMDAEVVLPQKFVVSKAYKAERKSYPIRWLIVVITTISALLLAMIIIAIVENTERIKRSFKEEKNLRKQS